MPFEWRTEGRTLLLLTAAFVAALWIPFDAPRFENSLHEAFALLQWYAREHVVSCLLPALLIAGAIAVFISQGAVIRLLGAGANKVVAYGIASISGTILAVCSCTVLPLFGGLYKRGAGLGPAIAFLYSGPAINILAIVLTAKVLGFELGAARAIGAVSFSVIIGLRHGDPLSPRRAGTQRLGRRRRDGAAGGWLRLSDRRGRRLVRADDHLSRLRQLGEGGPAGQRLLARRLRMEMVAGEPERRRRRVGTGPSAWGSSGGGSRWSRHSSRSWRSPCPSNPSSPSPVG